MATACGAWLILFSWLPGSILRLMPTHRQAGLTAWNVTACSRLITVIAAFSSSVRIVASPMGGAMWETFGSAGFVTPVCQPACVPSTLLTEGGGNQARNGVSHV